MPFDAEIADRRAVHPSGWPSGSIRAAALVLAASLGCEGSDSGSSARGAEPVVEMTCTLTVITGQLLDPTHDAFHEDAGLAEGLAMYQRTFTRRSDRGDAERRADPGVSLDLGEHSVHVDTQLEKVVRLRWRYDNRVIGSARAEAAGPGLAHPSQLTLEVRPILDGILSHDDRAWIACRNRPLSAP